MIVKIARYFSYPDLKRQTPNESLIWQGITFTEDDIDECDYLVILEYPEKDFSIRVDKTKIIHICMEPPNEMSKYRQYANKNIGLNINQLDIKKGNMLSHGALPWHIDKNYDFLVALKAKDLLKNNKIVWVTSNQKSSKGHIKRMAFLEKIKPLPFIKLYGRGINPIDDKWNALKTAKYAIAYENYQNNYYWTEKIVDSYLSYAMPLYFGCDKIEDYFPKDSFIRLDPNDKHINLFLNELVKSNKWEENINSIIKARELILNRYQLFPFLVDKILKMENNDNSNTKELIHFKGGDNYFDNYPLNVAIEKNILKIKTRIKNYLN